MFFKNNKINLGIMTVSIFLIPILFILILKMYYYILPGEEIGEIGDWISFSGGYVGAILALLGIWGQIVVQRRREESEKKEKDIGFLKYLVFTIENNIDNLENDYIFYKNTYFGNEFYENGYNENLFPKNIIEDYFNTLFKYEWSGLFFSVNKNIDKFNEMLNYVKINKSVNNTLFKEFKDMLSADAEAEKEIEERGSYTNDRYRYLYEMISVIGSISDCICSIDSKNKDEKLDDIFSKIEFSESSFDGIYSLFKEKVLNEKYLRVKLYEATDINFIKVELYLFSLFIVKNVIDDSFIDYKYFRKFKELQTFVNTQIEFIRVLIDLKLNLPILKENIESEYK